MPILPAADVSLEESLWKAWEGQRNASSKAALFDFYAEWSRLLAGHYRSRYPHPLAEFSDYLSLSSLGLLQAIDGYDFSRGARFKSYAEPFIKGSILKGLACYVKERQRDSRGRVNSLMEDSEGDDLEAIVNLAVGLAFGHFLELGILDLDSQADDPSSLYEHYKNGEILVHLVDQLSESERQVIAGHYYQQLSFVEISELLGVSKPRVSQLHGQALRNLRKLYESVAAKAQLV